MKLFAVKSGTEVKIIKVGQEWHGTNFVDHTTKNDNAFELEEMRVDPTRSDGKHFTCNRYHRNVVGGSWAIAGWYGFARDGYVIMIPSNKVEVL